MPLCHNPPFIFIHIPKCAGTSIGDALTNAGCNLEFSGPAPLPLRFDLDSLWLHHAPAKKLRKVISDSVWRSYFKFGFVRNPWDRLVSMFHYRRRKEPVYPSVTYDRSLGHATTRPTYWHKHLVNARSTSVAPNESFGEWVQRQVVRNKLAKGFSCCHYLYDDVGNLLVDEVFRYEHLESDFSHICNSLLLNARLARLNPSEHADYRAYYTPYLRDLVTEYFAEDIQRFEFRF
jgi:hypothetical protein